MDRPNIVYIMSDDHASHAMSCYGSRINRTPNLDRIADEGMRFDNCFCTNGICSHSGSVAPSSNRPRRWQRRTRWAVVSTMVRTSSSVSRVAVSAMRSPMQLGQKPRFLHEALTV